MAQSTVAAALILVFLMFFGGLAGFQFLRRPAP